MWEKAISVAKRYTDSQRLGYVENIETKVIPEAEFEFTYNAEVGLIVAITDYYTEDGKTYKVEWDGTQYICECPDGLIGNRGFAGEADTGEPFLITNGAIITAAEGIHTVSVAKIDRIIHPIPSEFIPVRPNPVLDFDIVSFNYMIHNGITTDDITPSDGRLVVLFEMLAQNIVPSLRFYNHAFGIIVGWSTIRRFVSFTYPYDVFNDYRCIMYTVSLYYNPDPTIMGDSGVYHMVIEPSRTTNNQST